MVLACRYFFFSFFENFAKFMKLSGYSKVTQNPNKDISFLDIISINQYKPK